MTKKIRFYILYQDATKQKCEAWIDAKDQGDLRAKFSWRREKGMELIKCGLLSEQKINRDLKEFGKEKDHDFFAN